MSQVITATYENGVFKPDTKVDLAAGAKVQLVMTPCTPTLEQRQRALAELERLRTQRPIDTRGERLTRDQLHERR